jgi:DNA-binding transcriptional ArsR family regulator
LTKPVHDFFTRGEKGKLTFYGGNRMGRLHFEVRPCMDHSEIEKISKALADETLATVSHHLKVLSDAGLISCQREGQFVYSEALPKTIADYSQALAKIANGKKTRR